MKLMEAADRGVRVRLLLDDIFTTVEDDAFEVMNQHPNIELRLFNPIGRGGVYYMNYLGDFKLANRRMHNFDILAAGPIAADIARTFDLFWNHELAVPMEAFKSKKELPDLATARAELDKKALESNELIYERALSSPLVQNLVEDKVALFPADSSVITDDPEKLLNKVSADYKVLVTALAVAVDEAESEVVVITPYFIPGKNGVEFWRHITNKGVRVVVVTNSLTR
jgi:putative cardiolipin synthase